MKWLLKVAAYRTLSALPGGVAMYRFSQEKLTRSLTPTRGRVEQKIEVGLQYMDWLERNGRKEQLLGGTHLDFGAGWHPTIPLLYYSMGVNRQYLFDVVPVLNERRLGQTLDVFLSMVNESAWPHRAKLRRLPPRLENCDWRSYFEQLGILYHAPYAGVIPSLAGSMDVVTCTQVLPYVSRTVLPWCFTQIHSSLKPGGVFLATVHLRDVMAGLSGRGLAKYKQLQYSPETWERWTNSSLMSYNPFKAPDYRELLEKAGFEIRHFEVEPGSAEDVEELNQIRIDPCFHRYSREDLAAKHLFFAAQKR
jgi:SAM-dependent methyltransferase